MRVETIKLCPPYSLGDLVTDTLQQVGFREVNRWKVLVITLFVAIGVLVVAVNTSVWVFFGAALLLPILPSVLRDLRFEGADGFRFRIDLERRAGAVDLALVPEGSTQPVATAELSDDEWTIPAGFTRRGTPEYLPALMGLLARGHRSERGEPLLSTLDKKHQQAALAFALLGHVGSETVRRGTKIRSALPILPFARGVLPLAFTLLLAILPGLLLNDVVTGAVIATGTVYGVVNLLGRKLGDHHYVVELRGHSWSVRVTAMAVELTRGRETHRERLRPSRLFDDDLALAKPELLAAGVDRLLESAVHE